MEKLGVDVLLIRELHLNKQWHRDGIRGEEVMSECGSVVHVGVSEGSGTDQGDASGESVPFPWSFGKYRRGFPGVSLNNLGSREGGSLSHSRNGMVTSSGIHMQIP